MAITVRLASSLFCRLSRVEVGRSPACQPPPNAMAELLEVLLRARHPTQITVGMMVMREKMRLLVALAGGMGISRCVGGLSHLAR